MSMRVPGGILNNFRGGTVGTTTISQGLIAHEDANIIQTAGNGDQVYHVVMYKPSHWYQDYNKKQSLSCR